MADPDTIAAIATPPGRGGVGIVRISGPEAAQIGSGVTGTELPTADPQLLDLFRVAPREYQHETAGVPSAVECVCTVFKTSRAWRELPENERLEIVDWLGECEVFLVASYSTMGVHSDNPQMVSLIMADPQSRRKGARSNKFNVNKEI